MAVNLEQHFEKNYVEGIDIRILEDAKNLQNWIKPLATCFELSQQDSNRYQYLLEQAAKHFIHYAGYDKDKIIATGSLFLGEKSSMQNYAGIYNICTLPEYNNRGIASAITLAIFQRAQQLNFSSATGQSTPNAKNLYERLGAESLAKLNLYY